MAQVTTPCHIVTWSCRIVIWPCRVVTWPCGVTLSERKQRQKRFHLSHDYVVTPILAHGRVAWLTRLCGHVLDALLHSDDFSMYSNSKTLFLPYIIPSWVEEIRPQIWRRLTWQECNIVPFPCSNLWSWIHLVIEWPLVPSITFFVYLTRDKRLILSPLHLDLPISLLGNNTTLVLLKLKL